MICGLCGSTATSLFYRDSQRHWDYHLCVQCSLVFKDPETYIEPAEEKARYATHNNSIEDQGYVDFLMPAVRTLLPVLNVESRGLDFGSGPGPIMDLLFARHDFKVENYDPFFANTPELLNEVYDFVTCTEVFEHFYLPGKEIDQLHKLVRAEGYLLLMSDFRKSAEHFAKWSYRMDNTHVCFLNQESLTWLCNHWGFELVSTDGRVSLLRKKS